MVLLDSAGWRFRFPEVERRHGFGLMLQAYSNLGIRLFRVMLDTEPHLGCRLLRVIPLEPQTFQAVAHARFMVGACSLGFRTWGGGLGAEGSGFGFRVLSAGFWRAGFFCP